MGEPTTKDLALLGLALPLPGRRVVVTRRDGVDGHKTQEGNRAVTGTPVHAPPTRRRVRRLPTVHPLRPVVDLDSPHISPVVTVNRHVEPLGGVAVSL